MRKITRTLLLLVTSITGWSQTVTTIVEGSPDDAITMDSNGNIYVTGFDSGSVYQYTSAGVMTEFLNGLSNPNGIGFNSADELYLCQWDENLIQRYNLSGTVLNAYNQTGNPSGMIKSFDSDDMIFTKYSGNSIHRLTPEGDVTTISSAQELNGPVGLAYDDSGNLYVGNYNNRQIYKVLSNGDLEYVATVGNSSNLGFIAYANGLLWGTVLGEHKIYTIDPTDVDAVNLYAGSALGSDDGDISQATFNRPNGIAFNQMGDVMYISEYGSKNIRVISGVNLSVNAVELEESFKVIQYQDSISVTALLPYRTRVFKIEIVDANGRVVKRHQGQPNENDGVIDVVMDVSGVANGSYFVKILSESHQSVKQIILR